MGWDHGRAGLRTASFLFHRRDRGYDKLLGEAAWTPLKKHTQCLAQVLTSQRHSMKRGQVIKRIFAFFPGARLRWSEISCSLPMTQYHLFPAAASSAF